MGWSYYNHKVADPVAEMTRLIERDDEHVKQDVIGAARTSGVIYMAVRRELKETHAVEVSAAVILFRNSEKDGFGYKDMGEDMGPCYYDCPDRIMELLTPTESEYAKAWRKRVAEQKERKAALRQKIQKIRKGAVLKLPHPVSFRNLGEYDTFKVIEVEGRRITLLPHGGDFYCRLRAATLALADVVPAV